MASVSPPSLSPTLNSCSGERKLGAAPQMSMPGGDRPGPCWTDCAADPPSPLDRAARGSVQESCWVTLGAAPARKCHRHAGRAKSLADNFDCTQPLLGQAAIKARPFNSDLLTQPQVLEGSVSCNYHHFHTRGCLPQRGPWRSPACMRSELRLPGEAQQGRPPGRSLSPLPGVLRQGNRHLSGGFQAGKGGDDFRAFSPEPHATAPRNPSSCPSHLSPTPVPHTLTPVRLCRRAFSGTPALTARPSCFPLRGQLSQQCFSQRHVPPPGFHESLQVPTSAFNLKSLCLCQVSKVPWGIHKPCISSQAVLPSRHNLISALLKKSFLMTRS